MKICVYPGSFDPVSNGHLNIIERIAQSFDEVYVLISLNPNKKYTFTDEERLYMMKKVTSHLKNVHCELSEKLMINYAKEKNAKIIIRGLRNISDYDDEMTRFQFNRTINENIDTFFLFPTMNNLFLSSSAIKELIIFDADVSEYLPKKILEFAVKIIKERK
ncbi:MAG: pantetheine-phosphate adenylyltransferase [Bacilli bacterium]|jgi:pantetheine-phosphate adenylyltransferase|nr:pantetheine-phosphate adenylyltransferase [Bacilli bacterium]MDD2681454.1 pantetheine-phosphate adenylyltransferase [Bacilli bacterium]MDD3121237.1 pantetheine-phosphate adenylyltransferase [Bacilli bacterium]MDD4062878.1 pantetheine-phosphate adenylyltransferase [Bacilli bacterium]MDD4481929.1 pantetheine-phosphate adenylyltransferase [Bacilli bacterium]